MVLEKYGPNTLSPVCFKGMKMGVLSLLPQNAYQEEMSRDSLSQQIYRNKVRRIKHWGKPKRLKNMSVDEIKSKRRIRKEK